MVSLVLLKPVRAILISLAMLFFLGHQLVPHRHGESSTREQLQIHMVHDCFMGLLQRAFALDAGTDHLQSFNKKEIVKLSVIAFAQAETLYVDYSTSQILVRGEILTLKELFVGTKNPLRGPPLLI